MSKIGKVSFLISGLFMVALFVARFVLGGWQNAMWAPLGIAIVFFFIAMAKDYRLIWGFFTMRTTKHGMNMGVLILIALVFLVTVNVLAVRYEKKFDVTSEGLNSLSPQSKQAAENLKQDVELVLLYRKGQQDGENIERNVRDLVSMYQNASKKIKFTAYNALQRPDLAQKYEFTYGPWGLFAVQGERHIKIDQPTEEEVTKTLLKIGRDKKKVIYFTMGHGERELTDRKPETITDLKDDLSPVYDVKPLTLFQTGNKVPEDADTVAIIGPQQQFLEPELQALRDFARRGGHFLIALDPGQHHNLAQLTKSFGVEFKNNYVLDPRANIPGAGNIAALGTDFSHSSDVTRDFPAGQMAVFLLASSVQKAPDAAAGLNIEDIVKTDGLAVTTNSLEKNPKMEKSGPQALAIMVKGKLPAAPAAVGADGKEAAAKESEPKEFSAVILGDSDFLSNALYRNNLNRDLAMNSFASLAQDKDLISIRPKAPKGTKLELTRSSFATLALFYVGIVLVMFFSGGFVWWRRRTA